MATIGAPCARRPISSVVEALPSSGIRAIFDEVTALEARGQKVIRFDIGRPDFETPPFVVEAAQQALVRGQTKYTGNRGIPQLLEAIHDKLLADQGVSYNPATEIIVTAGASEAVAAVMFGILEPGAEVLIPEPAWPHYEQCARLAGGTPVSVPVDVVQGRQLSVGDLERKVTSHTRLLVLNSPNNPTGQVLARETLVEVLEFAHEHGLYVLSDEIYEPFCYDEPHVSFASLPGAREITIFVHSFSKAYGMTGWRLGYLAAPARLVSQLNKPHQYLTVCANSFAQWGAVQAYRHPQSPTFLAQIAADFKRRRDTLLEIASEVPAMRFPAPQGAFYFFPALADGRLSSSAAALKLLKEAGVATVPGSVFGSAFDRHLRISYGSCSLEDLREGLQRIANVLY